MSSAGGSSGSTSSGSPEHPAAPLASSVLGVSIIAITGMQLMSDARRDHRHRRAAAHAGRSRPVRRGQELGHHRLRAGVRWAAAARRARWRRHRAQARVPLRRRRLHPRVPRVWAGRRRIHSDCRTGTSGRRRRGRRPDRVRPHRHHVRHRKRPQSGHGGVGRHASDRIGARAGARWLADRDLVAPGVPHQRPRRHRDRRDRRSAHRRDPSRTAQARHHRRRPSPRWDARRPCWSSPRGRRGAGSTPG